MSSALYIFCFFTTVLVLVHGQEFDHKEDVEHHNYIEIKSCPRREIIANRKSGSLMPRDRLVTLKAEPGFEFFPRSVSVKRCNGHCSNNLSPMPTMSKPKNFTVHLHQKGNHMPLKCVAVTVLEHQACRCMCMKSEKDCNSEQTWNEANCDCMCKNREKKKSKCEATPNMVWYDLDCSCTCPPSLMKCTSGEMWSEHKCACIPIKKPLW